MLHYDRSFNKGEGDRMSKVILRQGRKFVKIKGCNSDSFYDFAVVILITHIVVADLVCCVTAHDNKVLMAIDDIV
jgi:hypothetical protein